jgi:hypothetical protein
MDNYESWQGRSEEYENPVSKGDFIFGLCVLAVVAAVITGYVIASHSFIYVVAS